MSRKGRNIYKRKDGRWEGRLLIGQWPDGRTRYASVYGKTFRETKDKLEKRMISQASKPVAVAQDDGQGLDGEVVVLAVN